MTWRETINKSIGWFSASARDFEVDNIGRSDEENYTEHQDMYTGNIFTSR